MRVSLSTFKHVLPTGRAWALTINKQLRQFFTGLAVPLGDAQDYQDDVYGDVRPQYTSKLSDWEFQFGIFTSAATEQDRRDRLAAAWRALGGQDPRYLQDTIQAAGFPLYVHEWWWPGAGSPAARNPNAYVAPAGAGAFVVVMLGTPGVQLGRGSTQLGKARKLRYLLDDNLPAPPVWPQNDPNAWPYFLYFGGAVFGDVVQIPAEREAELRTLILKLCPAQLWVGLLVEFV